MPLAKVPTLVDADDGLMSTFEPAQPDLTLCVCHPIKYAPAIELDTEGPTIRKNVPVNRISRH